MSQKASRKGVVTEEKEKLDTPVKDMKKKMAANAEKEKQSAEKKEAEKPVEKALEKNEKPAAKAEKAVEKAEKTEKAAEKADKTEKAAEKKAEKVADKKAEKSAEKKSEAPVEKKEDSKDDKNGKSDKADRKADRPKQNGRESRVTNGAHVDNGAASAPDDYDDEDAAATDHDEMFPELAYDDTSDAEFEPRTPDALDAQAGRSFTRRSQAKATRTPETPRPASDKQPEKDAADDSKDSKVLKLKEDAPPATDRKLRSADSPKPQEKKEKETKKQSESPRKQDGDAKGREGKENGEKSEKADVEVVVEVEDEPARKPDTNYSKSRVKVSPYRRSGRLADHTASSVLANYTGNNTTMEMDITETTSSFLSEEPSLDDSSYLAGLRSIRGRRSYKLLKDMPPRQLARSAVKPVNVSASDQPSRPTAPVVGRKRKPEGDDSAVDVGVDAGEALSAGHSKRMRLLDRLAHSFRRTASSTPLPARRAAEIVGINTDLPLTAPVAQAETFDPEALKPAEAPIAVPLAPAAPAPESDRDNKRCVVM